ncbi:MAG: 50S ribosomal protein L11 methyltransferase [Faecalibacterium sp.]|nr:50S ribosomal protein L11 methyltransferase [Ruminococcus sp.]MCM1485018.1 50S ribosomal protein L11 methyltransferase [Faecalibacterium sp.]
MSEWTEVKICVNADDVDKAGDIAMMVVPYGIYIEDYRNLEQQAWEIARIDLIDEELLAKDRTKAFVHIYISPEENPLEAVAFLRERFTSEGIENEIVTNECCNEDWENNWKQYFHPIPVGEKLLIRPIWEEEYDAGDRKVLNIEPGLAFGTGTHETTRLCLETLEKHITPEKTVLDIGCGSGILSIASLLLGAKSATGVDIDALAVKTAIENGKENGFSEPEMTVLHGNLAEKVSGKFDIVVANIVADVIILFCKDVASFMKDDAIFITSGIIDTREQDVIDAFEKYGFSIKARHTEKGWVCFECVKK